MLPEAIESESEVDPTPDLRCTEVEGAAGTAVVLGDGREWLLADSGLMNDLDEVRDRIFDEAVLRGSVSAEDVRGMALVLLLANYDLQFEEAIPLIAGADAKALATAVLESILGPKDEGGSYTEWAAASLWANGLDPESIPGPMRRSVLRILVDTGRTVPCSEFCDAVAAAEQRKQFQGFIKPAETMAQPDG